LSNLFLSSAFLSFSIRFSSGDKFPNSILLSAANTFLSIVVPAALTPVYDASSPCL
jgi:hypothetical protein